MKVTASPARPGPGDPPAELTTPFRISSTIYTTGGANRKSRRNLDEVQINQSE